MFHFQCVFPVLVACDVSGSYTCFRFYPHLCHVFPVVTRVSGLPQTCCGRSSTSTWRLRTRFSSRSTSSRSRYVQPRVGSYNLYSSGESVRADLYNSVHSDFAIAVQPLVVGRLYVQTCTTLSCPLGFVLIPRFDSSWGRSP